MKKTLTVIILILAVAFFLLNSRLGLIHCNMRKDYKSMNERYFEGIRNRIADLEKEPVKDATTVRRLAEQYNLMGNYYIKNSLWDMAIEAYRNSIRYGSNTADIYYSLGLAYGNRGAEKKSSGDIDQAEICYTKALELDPSHHESRYGLAIILFYHREGKREEALKLVDEIAAKSSKFYAARFARGRFNYEMGNKEKALSIYQDLEPELERLPSSSINNEYKLQCRENIERIRMELSGK
jgi:tetratricopeptide (TPR) repeat protein